MSENFDFCTCANFIDGIKKIVDPYKIFSASDLLNEDFLRVAFHYKCEDFSTDQNIHQIIKVIRRKLSLLSAQKNTGILRIAVGYYYFTSGAKKDLVLPNDAYTGAIIPSVFNKYTDHQKYMIQQMYSKYMDGSEGFLTGETIKALLLNKEPNLVEICTNHETNTKRTVVTKLSSNFNNATVEIILRRPHVHIDETNLHAVQILELLSGIKLSELDVYREYILNYMDNSKHSIKISNQLLMMYPGLTKKKVTMLGIVVE
jgi:hypothetical protein